MESLGQRLKTAREAAKLSQRALARRTGLSQQLISKLESGLIESTTEIFPLAKALLVDARWLATGEGGMRPGAGLAESGAGRWQVPLVSWVAAGLWQDIVLDDLSDRPMIPVTKRVSDDAYALRIQGDSMEPMFPNRSVIVVDPVIAPQHGSYVVVRLERAEQATFKQLMIDGANAYLKPLNPRYPILEMSEEATLCGVVRQMVMDFD